MVFSVLLLAGLVSAFPRALEAEEPALPRLFARQSSGGVVAPAVVPPPLTVAGQVVRANISYEPDFPSPAGLPAKFQHVVFLSIDGMHQSDLEYFIQQQPNSTLATLVNGGISFTNASTSTPSDSFPGTMALVTGASSRTHGVYYDVAYARDLYPPGSNCSGLSGANYAFDETLDLNNTELSGGGGFNTSMFNMKLNSVGRCVKVAPYDYLTSNTVFEVARFAGYQTAYTDKHPAYTIVNGPSGIGLADAYFPEINAVSGLAQTEGYDALHWSALTNWTFGGYYNGTAWATGTPNLYGSNFQAVSVAQKTYGYLDNGTVPTANLTQAIEYTDTKLGGLLQNLQQAGIYNETLLIVTAKHGQSPKNLALRRIIDDSFLQDSSNITFAGYAADDGAYIWLDDYSQAAQVKQDLLNNATNLGIAQVFAGFEVAAIGLGNPQYDARAPDVVVRSLPGVIYASPTATKVAEHGGFNPDDLQVPLIVFNPNLQQTVISSKVDTRQIPATALYALGLDPLLLNGVRQESTPILPGVFTETA